MRFSILNTTKWRQLATNCEEFETIIHKNDWKTDLQHSVLVFKNALIKEIMGSGNIYLIDNKNDVKA